MQGSIQDQWAQWLLRRRHGDDPKQLQHILDSLYPVRDRILRNARVAEGEVLLDVGAGDGLIAFGALELVGKRGKVIFCDISKDLLEHSRSLAQQMNVIDRCQFLHTSAENLSALETASVDVVTTRSVLIYVENKQKAFEEFYRVLKPQGRFSIFEPINRFSWPEPPNIFVGYDVTSIQPLAQKVRAVYERLQPIATDPMLNFDERDLIAFAEKAGFQEMHLELEAEIIPKSTSQSPFDTWEMVFRTAGNPKIPTVEEAMKQVLTSDEIARFEAHLRPLVERGQGVTREARAYLSAMKFSN